MVKRLREFQPQNISNTVWAFASLGQTPSEAFLKAVEEHVVSFIDSYSPQVGSLPEPNLPAMQTAGHLHSLAFRYFNIKALLHSTFYGNHTYSAKMRV